MRVSAAGVAAPMLPKRGAAQLGAGIPAAVSAIALQAQAHNSAGARRRRF